MIINDIIQLFEAYAPIQLQESYDNSGLITGDKKAAITGTLITLDCTESIVDEAIANNCNLIVAHHPIIFSGLKKITGKNYVERVIIKAIKNDIAIYSVHTNLDNVSDGVNGKIAERLGLQNIRVLQNKAGILKKLVTFIPSSHAEQVQQALFKAGAGHIGNYSDCGFSNNGTGSFKGNELSSPFAGKPNELHIEEEVRFETIVPIYLQNEIIAALLKAHPYEEVAYDIIPIENTFNGIGSGLIGELAEEMNSTDFLKMLKEKMELTVIKFTPFDKPIKKIALCGGAGQFLLKQAIQQGADAFISADFKYHEFFDAEQNLMIADIGHYESEKFTKELMFDLIMKKNPTFALLLSKINTNPVNYYY
ncbi:MAG: Nif3-like dinuclear metal center hexameric protein [Bacteroidota bacterium]